MANKKTDKAVRAIEKALKKAVRNGVPEKSVEKGVSRAIKKISKPPKGSKNDNNGNSPKPAQ